MISETDIIDQWTVVSDCITKPDETHQAVEILTTEMFTERDCRTLFEVFKALHADGLPTDINHLVRRLEDPQQVRATQTAVLTVSSTIRVLLFAFAGTYSEPGLLLLVLALLPAMALGLYIGHRITLKMNRQRFMQVLHAVLLLTGGSLLLRAI